MILRLIIGLFIFVSVADASVYIDGVYTDLNSEIYIANAYRENQKSVCVGGEYIDYWYAEPYGTETYAEIFADEENIESYSGVVFNVHTPTKSTDNPIIALNTIDGEDYTCDPETWDVFKNLGSIFKNADGIYEFWYNGWEITTTWDNFDWDSLGNSSMCVAYSTDGINWYKPNLGLYSYGGNTNNNITFAYTDYNESGFVTYDVDDSSHTYACYRSEGAEGSQTHEIYSNTDPATNGWTAQKTMSTTDEVRDIFRLSDGTFGVYYKSDDGTYDDSSIYGQSASTLSGAWTPEGEVLSAVSDDIGKHGLYTEYLENTGIYLMLSVEKSRPTGYESPKCTKKVIQLGISRDPFSYTSKHTDWIPSPSCTQDTDYDCAFHWGPKHPIREGDKWRIYYQATGVCYGRSHTGDFGTSDYIVETLMLADIDYRRIFSVSGTGSIITDSISSGNDVLYINADNGSIDVELLNASTDAVLSGYSQSDCDTISGRNGKNIIVSWNGSSALPAQDVKIKIYLTSSYLYSFSLRNL